MTRRLLPFVAMAGLIGLAGCDYAKPPNTSILAHQRTADAVTDVAPVRPPPPMYVKLVPAPPQGPPVAWHPGHWWYAKGMVHHWIWMKGHYVAPPPGKTTWVPGRWVRQTDDKWGWLPGYWA